VIDFFLDLGSYDSQCGAKLMTRKMAQIAFKEPFISPWIFDIEIMLRVKESNILEYPLTQWEDIPGSKIKIIREAFRILKDILRIRNKYLDQ
jgi:dolichyl-phosphate beta-glucosyltransferase